MDMSKLPRLSQTNKGDAPEPVAGQQVVAPPPAPQADVRDYERRDPTDYDAGYSVGAEVWISVILGIVFMFMGFNFARFVGATLTGQPYHTGVNWTAGENEGKEVGYFDLQGGTAYTESGIFLFGLALVLEAAALLAAHAGAPGRRGLVGLALFVTVTATVYNLFVAGTLFTMGITPLMTIIAVAIGGYMATYQWRLFKDVAAMRSSR
jgi:hypothetical protein